MSFPTKFDIATGSAAGWRSIKVPGRNTEIGQTFEPVAPNGIFRTPQPSGAASLRIRAGGNANDSAAGSGARAVQFYGLDANGLEVTETITTAGASASIATTTQFMRLLEARVTESGTYASQSAGSHSGDIIIEDTAGNFWASLPVNGFPEGRTRIGIFTTPKNYEAWLFGIRVNADSGKTVDALVFQRPGILETTAPYQAMTMIDEVFNATGFLDIGFSAPIYIPPLTDVGVMATVDVQTARVGSDLGLLLRRV